MRLVNKLLARAFRAAARRFRRQADELDPRPKPPAPAGSSDVWTIPHAGRVVLFAHGMPRGLALTPVQCRQLRQRLRRAEAEACGLTGLMGELALGVGAG